MKNQQFGIEIEMTGITRKKASEVIAEYFGTYSSYDGGSYSSYSATDNQNRKWKLMSDASIDAQKKENGRIVSADYDYRTELVSPICKYKDIERIQEIVRKLRANGALVNDSCGIHVHVDAMPYDSKSLRNLTNIMRSKEDILYKALQVNVAREHQFCKKVEDSFIDELNRRKPQTREQLKSIWYKGDDGSHQHYHNSRYHALNLHSVFQKGTVEFRLFNGTLHAGKIKSYLQLSLAISNQALTQKSASHARTASSNEKYTFRTWLLRLGMIGDEFKTAREHLLAHLEGNIAWKDPAQAEKQKERLAQQKQQIQAEQPSEHQLQEPSGDELETDTIEQEQEIGFSMNL